ncbi:MAG: filamentous hemagglutinin N-terminal domain-containing protein, partial [Phormidesmis sp. CAN_BIN36]|nr:filamentous hemagglutinin N-terminal domain-containing protein [Phormidesmis sp. CAN_BIN36]
MVNYFKTGLVCGVGLTIAASGLCVSQPAFAQVIPDRTLGSESSVVNPDVLIRGLPSDLVDGGARRGANLFHSFLEFNVAAGRGVYFSNPIGVGNIFSRVTGSNASSIAGRLGVLGNANLFLLNPNGILFGPNASLDVAGSFTASTASSLLMADGTVYSATSPTASSLLTVSVPLGVQFGKDQPKATITNWGNLSTGQDLTLEAGNLDLQGQLQAGGNLTLKATDTVKIRDTVTKPFVARSGGEMLIQGNQAVDIFALNNTASGLFSGRDMVLQSASTVGGDAHYFAGGDFKIEQLDGKPGSLLSFYDPIVLAVGNVKIGDYGYTNGVPTGGASLHILAGGSVELGNVFINATGEIATTINPSNTDVVPGTTNPYSELSAVTLSDSTTIINIDGNARQTLDVRAGIDWNLTPFKGSSIIGQPTAFPPGSVPFLTPTSDILSSDITISSITNRATNGDILLTNQFKKHSNLNNGSIKVTGSVVDPNDTFSISAYAVPVTIDSRGDVRVDKGIVTGTAGRPGGDVLILSGGNVDIVGQGSVTGNIGSLLSLTDQNSGNITIKASGNINNTPDIFLNGSTRL